MAKVPDSDEGDRGVGDLPVCVSEGERVGERAGQQSALSFRRSRG